MKKISAVMASMILMLSALHPAQAFLGIGDIVLDPSNLAQNILSAERALAQIENQIQQLENETQMLLNDARNLASLDINTLARLRVATAAMQRLFDEGRGLAYEVARVHEEFARLYPEAYNETISREQLNTDRLTRWLHSREAIGTAMQLQAQAKQNFAQDEAILTDLINRSQEAVGALQAAQATNQLLALQSRQLMQAQQLQISNDRALVLEHARMVAAEERARELRRRFMTRETRYTPEPVRLF